MLQSNTTTNVIQELALMNIANMQCVNERQVEMLNKLVDEAERQATEDLHTFLQHTSDDVDYKDVACLREQFMQNACNAVGVIMVVISDAYSCPRNPQYEYKLSVK